MRPHEVDFLFYAMTRVARLGRIEADRAFARKMADAAQDRRFKPSRQQIERMTEVEARLYREGGAA
ncbi:hypothetical protein [Rhodovulum sulfidophilum]|uniref:hypothetical protein n=1 Tax=Rhodovulum sulfidophilum TaxID=35806 RepID=UPI0009528983|nr:hypothetical protein [Rhodovulum sulfidophilum]MBL3553863.1 hypothetical protein [Rhodovulum sulfidophilum]OLS46984.1 hypothetical protein BV379_00890 [Rhodovulum sulfidophilum]